MRRPRSAVSVQFQSVSRPPVTAASKRHYSVHIDTHECFECSKGLRSVVNMPAAAAGQLRPRDFRRHWMRPTKHGSDAETESAAELVNPIASSVYSRRSCVIILSQTDRLFPIAFGKLFIIPRVYNIAERRDVIEHAEDGRVTN